MENGRVMKVFSIVSTVALVVSIVLTVITSVFGYLTFVSATGPKCANVPLVEGYHLGIDYLLWLPLFSAGIVLMVVRGKSDKRVEYVLRDFDFPVLTLASMQLTYGKVLLYGILFALLMIQGIMAGYSVTRYIAIEKYCVTATIFSPWCGRENYCISSLSSEHSRVIESVDPEPFAFLKCKVQMRDGSDGQLRWFCDVIRVLDALDEENSDVEIAIANDGSKIYRPVIGGGVTFKPEAIDSHHIFQWHFIKRQLFVMMNFDDPANR